MPKPLCISLQGRVAYTYKRKNIARKKLSFKTAIEKDGIIINNKIKYQFLRSLLRTTNIHIDIIVKQCNDDGMRFLDFIFCS